MESSLGVLTELNNFLHQHRASLPPSVKGLTPTWLQVLTKCVTAHPSASSESHECRVQQRDDVRGPTWPTDGAPTPAHL